MDPVLVVKDLKKYFPVRKGFWFRDRAEVRAVDGVSFSIRRGETMGLVGESGCGKSTTARLILRLLEPSAGEVHFGTTAVFQAGTKAMRQLRRKMQIVFQDPYSSLDPRMTVKEIVGEGLTIHRLAKGRERDDRVAALLEMVGLGREHMGRYPHEFSGGQRQRLGIARALATRPKLIICDEPVSALDVSIQTQVITLLIKLREEFNLTYVFIAHDLSVVRYISDRVAVMYLGRIVEITDSDELYDHPLHPYTQALLSAVPIPNPAVDRQRKRILLTGDVPSPMRPPPGCTFHPRCSMAIESCKEAVPEGRDVG
ncbi:MAG TPA: ABC transporter ATP-binding protein, partial [Candidatus Methylomirabilis sp.]